MNRSELDPTAPGEARDWATLPDLVLCKVFLKLGPREIMLGAEFVCTAWRRVALEEPSLWRRIGWHTAEEQLWRFVDGNAESAMAFVALARAAGQCEAFNGEVGYEELPVLVERAPSLKNLDMTTSYSNDEKERTAELIAALTKLPLLENLKICFSHKLDERADKMLRSLCQACRNLKQLVLMYATPWQWDPDHDMEDEYMEEIDGEIPLMHELRTLELHDCDLTCKGLEGILDNCPLLESLHVTGYFYKYDMIDELKVKCARLTSLTLPTTLNPGDRLYYAYGREPDDSEEEEEDFPTTLNLGDHLFYQFGSETDDSEEDLPTTLNPGDRLYYQFGLIRPYHRPTTGPKHGHIHLPK